eukprot:6544288-Prymnesium_polylepis.1
MLRPRPNHGPHPCTRHVPRPCPRHVPRVTCLASRASRHVPRVTCLTPVPRVTCLTRLVVGRLASRASRHVPRGQAPRVTCLASRASRHAPRVTRLLLAAPRRGALGVGAERHRREVVLERNVAEVVGHLPEVKHVPARAKGGAKCAQREAGGRARRFGGAAQAASSGARRGAKTRGFRIFWRSAVP